MAKTVSDALRTSVADTRVANIDAIELLDGANGTVIASTTGVGWNAASGGSVSVSGTPTLDGNASAGAGTQATHARLYHTGASGDELDNLIVDQDQNYSAWSTNTSYTSGDRVTNTIGGTTFYFKATTGHTSSSSDEPGVGDEWRTYWELQDIVISNTNIADGDKVDINSMVIVEPDLLQ